ncbi:MAG TPA: tetratricopeptide repeat protein, partial [Rhodothermales bacterium]
YSGDVETALSMASAVNRNTSMDVANDAIELRLLLQENQGPDSLNTVLRQYGRALYLQRRGQQAAALEVVDSLLAQQANHPVSDDARFLRGGLLRASGSFEAAWTAYAELPLLHPHSPLGDRALFQAADVLARDLENGEAAIEYYTRLLTEYPGSVLAAEARARIRALRGDGV